MDSEFAKCPFFVLMIFHFIGQELASPVTMDPFDPVSCMCFEVSFISFVRCEGLIFRFQEIQLCFTGVVVHPGCGVVVSADALDGSRTP